jgi:hypothetical protein
MEHNSLPLFFLEIEAKIQRRRGLGKLNGKTRKEFKLKNVFR